VRVNSESFVSASIVIVILSLSVALAAQTVSYKLSASVKDEAGNPVPNAKLSLKNTSTGQRSETQAHAQGNYHFDGLAPGSYEISASAEGFAIATCTCFRSRGARSIP
jgi:Carboxypeptidase regulatory-like domain